MRPSHSMRHYHYMRPSHYMRHSPSMMPFSLYGALTFY